MARLEMILLGGFQARLAPGGAINLPTRKAQALLAYLALPPGRTHSRDKLAALLWPDVPESQARRSLRKALFWLRQTLAPSGALTADGEGLGLRADAVSVDVGEFEHRIADGSPAALGEAADIYQGELLAGLSLRDSPFEEWLVGERDRLRELHVEALARLLAHQRRDGAVEGAIATALKLLAADPLQEPVHRALMRLYAQAGRRDAALRQYQACVAVLERELRVPPQETTRALYRDILQARAPDARAPAGPGAAVETPAALPEPDGAPAPAAPGAGPPPFPAEAPLIGRHRELAELTALLEDAWRGGRRLAAIVGEAGVGKTRLAGALGTVAGQRGGRVLLGRCYESERSLPFSPWIEALRGAELTAHGELLDALSPVWRAELARLLPELHAGALPPADPTDVLRLFEAMAQCLDALAGRAPLLVVLEDLQWSDDLSFRLAGFLGRRARAGSMLILGTLREEEIDAGALQHRAGQALVHENLMLRLPLARLTRDETRILTRGLAGAGSGPDLTALEKQIWRVSEGNPFIVVETLRAVRERGDGRGIGEGLVPVRVRDLVAGRLAALTERGRHLVDVAAVIGRRFEFALLQRASGLDEHAAADGVEELVRRGILEQAVGGFEFTHDQIREVHCAEMVGPLRALLHRRVAQALEALHPRDAGRHALALGTHYREGGDWEKAVTHLRQAGLVAASRYAGREAGVCFEEALRALDQLPESRRVQEQRFELSVGLARTRYWFGQFDRATAGYREAERLAHALGDDRRLGQVLGALVYLRASEGRYTEAIAAGAQALAIAETTADRSLTIWTSIGLGRSHFAVGDYRRGAELTRWIAESIDETELDEYLRPGALRPSVGCRTWLALCLARLGSFEEGLQWAEDAVRIADGTESLQAQVWAWYTLGHIGLERGEAEASLGPLDHARGLCEKGELPLYRPRVLGALGHARGLTGKVDAGLALLDQALEETRAGQVVYGCTSLLIAQAETYLEAGRLDDAGRVAVEALPRARERGERGDEGWLRGVLGAVALRRGRAAVGEAMARFEEAVALARELGMRPLEARGVAGLGRGYLAAGRPREARLNLEQAVRLFRATAMPRRVASTDALLSETTAEGLPP